MNVASPKKGKHLWDDDNKTLMFETQHLQKQQAPKQSHFSLDV